MNEIIQAFELIFFSIAIFTTILFTIACIVILEGILHFIFFLLDKWHNRKLWCESKHNKYGELIKNFDEEDEEDNDKGLFIHDYREEGIIINWNEMKKFREN